jgi:hypothetical protein
MNSPAWIVGAALFLAAPAWAQAPQQRQAQGGGLSRETTFSAIAAGPWRGPRTADGQPDVAGFYSNTIGNHSNFTDPQAGPPGEHPKAADLPRNQRAPSRVSDPADGQVPYLPAARALQEDFARNFADPVKARYVEPLARCAPAGVPKSFMWHGFEIRQYKDTVLLWFDSGWRLIHLDKGTPLPEQIKLWNGDSHGHWEGNTLVVHVTNNNGKALFGRYGDFMSENATVVERYIFRSDGQRFNYVATFTDPTVYSRPWTATIPVRRYTAADKPDGWHFDVHAVNWGKNAAGKGLAYEHDERICAENNGGFGGGAVGVPGAGVLIAR